MNNVVVSILLMCAVSSIAQIDAQNEMAQSSMDKLVNELFDRVLDTLPRRGADLDGTTLGKPGHVATPSKSLRPLLRPSYSQHVSRDSKTLPWTSYRGAMADYDLQQGLVARSGMRTPSQDGEQGSSSISKTATDLTRRNTLAGLAAFVGAVVLPAEEAQAVQGYTAGRIPGISPSDEEGFLKYSRPLGKQGGHGIGWSEIPPYSFLVPEGWKEVPVSIADLGGTEVDLRFVSTEDTPKRTLRGDLAVVVAPVLRFTDVGFNADVRIDKLGTPEKMISGFGPEIMQQNVDDMIESSAVRSKDGLMFYDYELNDLKKGRVLITMTAVKNRVYIMALRPKDNLAWKRNEETFHKMVDSFLVDTGGKEA